LKTDTFLRLNPLLGFLGDGYSLLNATRTQEKQEIVFAMSRASTMHSLAALHSAGNALLHFAEDRGWTQSGLVRKFDRVFELNGLDALPENEMEILAELDQVHQIVNNPSCGEGEVLGQLPNGKRLEFKRTPLRKFNYESLNWPPQYAACVLALVVRFLNRLFKEHLRYDDGWVEVAVGHHLSRETGYSSYLDPERVRQIQLESKALVDWQELMTQMKSERWCLQEEFFQAQFLC
jgi:hypothetical protein